jgi:signal transduction histidine kinase
MIAFENIIENANKFSNNKRVKIDLIYTLKTIVIVISDFGIGIPGKDLNNVLQTFYRAENARSFSGSGVGLSLCQKIILLHNGTLSIQSELGKGTEVIVMLKKA